MIVTQDQIEDNASASNKDIEKDIKIANEEIKQLKIEIEGLRLVSKATIGTFQGRLDNFKYENRKLRLIDERKLVEFLEALLKARDIQ